MTWMPAFACKGTVFSMTQVFAPKMPRETPDLHVPDSPDLHGVASLPVDEAREARPLLSSAFQAVVEKLVHLHVKDLQGHMGHGRSAKSGVIVQSWHPF